MYRSFPERKSTPYLSEHPYKPLARTEGIWPRAYRGLADYWSRPLIRGYRALVLVDDLSATFHMMEEKFLLTLGVQGGQEKATVTDENLSDPYDEDSTISVREKNHGRNRILGTFVQAEYSPIDSLTAYFGGRYDHWWGDDADYSNADGTNLDYEDTDDGQFNPKLSIVYRPTENGSFRASYGEAFTAPSLYYRTSSYYWEAGGTISVANPNPDLEPTTNKSWEIGTEWLF